MTNGKKKRETPNRDILSFFEEEEIKQPKPERATEVEVKTESEILKFIKLRGKVAKSELYNWAKKHNIKPADLYGILRKLQRQNVIKTFFDEEFQEIAYQVV
ncbi:MAG: hypothetical protein B6U95_05370 [Thermofilum sp. ex4484_82]|nr:MAG: hypothetical protein B6U95_05370 [Thermofilum sp. ex4484_82]OYT38034.1 MAG: hypothetical protein B6U96_05365 [Archaeoglobales archaeon ex4484_92]